MFRSENFTSDSVNVAEYNHIAELLAFDIDKGKNVFLYGKKGSGKSKIADILALMSERELIEIAQRLISKASDDAKKEELLSLLNQLISNTKIFGRNMRLLKTNNIEGNKDNGNNEEKNKISFKEQLAQAQDITKSESTREESVKKIQSVVEDMYDFLPTEVNGLKEPYLWAYTLYRTMFREFFFVLHRLDTFRAEGAKANFSSMVNVLLNTINILPYKKRYVFIVDNFEWFANEFWGDLVHNVQEWNTQGIQFIFISDSLPVQVSSKENQLNISLREIDNSKVANVFSSEIIDSFAKQDKGLWAFLSKNKEAIVSEIAMLRENGVITLAEPGATESFLLNLKQNYTSKQLSETAFQTKTEKINLKDLEKENKKFNLKDFLLERYPQQSKKKLLSKQALTEGYKKISEQIFGQDKQIKQLITNLYQKTALGETPRWVYMLLWPTGVWKTEAVKQITKVLYETDNWEDNLMIIPMEQYTDLSKLNILQGSPAGYVGYGQGENLADKLLKMKEGIILFDEIEKANTDVIKALLTTLEEWKLQMGNWEVADLKNYSIIFTSNAIVSLEDVAKSKKKATKAPRTNKKIEELTEEEIRVMCLDYLKEENDKKFLPEFLGRINSCIVFNQLTEDKLVAVMFKALEQIKQKYIKVFNEESGVSLKDIIATVELSDEEMYQVITETINSKLWARYLMKRVDEIVMHHQDKLFGIDAETNNATPEKFKSDYEKYLEIKNKKLKENSKIISKEKIAKTYKDITSELFGQNEAIKSLLVGISSAYMENKKPRGVHMLIWPTGVGKTETARQLAKHFYGSENNLVIVPMNEYTSEIDINKLKGSPAGYVGHDDARTLKDRVDEVNGGGVLLLDEIEKAHPKIIQAFLWMFETGKMEMQESGLYADLSNFIILLTTNALTDIDGALERYKKTGSAKQTIGFATVDEKEKTSSKLIDIDTYEGKVAFLVSCLKGEIDDESISGQAFSPEFLGRIDSFHYYKGFYSNDDAEVYNKVVDKWKRERKAEIEAVNDEEIGIPLKERLKFINHTDEELQTIYKEIQKTKLGIRSFIKKLDELKNKKMKDYITGSMDLDI